MRYNAKELTYIARERSSYFDFESILFVKERSDGLFKKGKAFVDKFFRLKGNILFYFKGKDKQSEIGGVYILERCCVQLEEDEFDEFYFFCFSIVFEDDQSQNVLFLGSTEEHIRDRWIELIHVSSFECMKFQLDSLRDRIKSKTGADPIYQLQERGSEAADGLVGSFLEMDVNLNNLPVDSYGRPPDTFASVHYFATSMREQWVFHGNTEVIEKSCNPTFVSVITFKHFDVINFKTKLRLAAHVIKERMTQTAVTIGTAEFTMMEILSSPTMSCGFILRSSKYDEVGTVILSLRLNKNSSNGQISKGYSCDIDQMSPFSPSSQFMNEALLSTPQLRTRLHKGNFRINIDSLFLAGFTIKTFRFPVTGPISSSGLLVNERLAEFKHAFMLPYHFLNMLVQDEKQKILSYRNLGKLSEKYEMLRSSLIDFHISTIVNYEQQIKFFSNNINLSFKPSVKKSHKEVEFVPTNLHVHSMFVSHNIKDECSRHDIVTVGAFTAGAQKYKHGGLRRLAIQLDQSLPKGDNNEVRIHQCRQYLNFLDAVQDEIFLKCDNLCSTAVSGKTEPVLESFKSLEQKVKSLLKKCGEALVSIGLNQLRLGRYNSSSREVILPPGTLLSDCDEGLCDDLQNQVQEESMPAENWIWNGTDYVKGATEEPYEMVKLNTEASLVDLRGKIQVLIQQSEDEAVSWLERISPPVIALKKCVKVLAGRTKQSLNFLIMEDVAYNLPLYHSLKCRKDVIFSQALTTAVGGFLSKLSCIMSLIMSFRSRTSSSSSSSSLSSASPNHRRHRHPLVHSSSSSSLSSSASALQTTLRHLLVYSRIGILMQFESLLSCYGDELNMLEDHSEGVADLSRVKFKIEPKRSSRTSNEQENICEGSSGSSSNDTNSVSSDIFNKALRVKNSNSESQAVTVSASLNENVDVTTDSEAVETNVDVPVVDVESNVCDGLIDFPKNNKISTTDMIPKPTAVSTTTTNNLQISSASDSLCSSVSNSNTFSMPAQAQSVNKDEQFIDYQITGCRSRCEVVFSLPEDIYRELKSGWASKPDFDGVKEALVVQLVPVLFNIGINEQATLAEKFFSIELQEEINQENFHKLNNYFKDYCSLPTELRGFNIKTLNSSIQLLHQNVFILKKNKNVEILHLAADICRKMDGVRFTSCKSAKDRTAMSVTLEEVDLLKREHDLSADQFNHALDALRSEGVRRDNTYKNTGVRKYAFNSIQLLSIPKLYRPPKGTYGNSET